MDMKARALKIFKGYISITTVMAWIGGAIATIIITGLVFVDVFGRYIFSKPLQGANEIVERTMIGLAGCAILYAANKGGHIGIDIIMNRFPKNIQVIMQSIFSWSGFGICVIVGYRLFVYGLYQMQQKAASDILQMPLAPFTFMMAVTLSLCSLSLLIQALFPELTEESIIKDV